MKIKITAFALAFSIMLCVGCAKSGGEQTNGVRGGNMQQSNQRQQTTVTISNEVKQNATKVVTGTVESIVGNEVTMLITSESGGAEADSQSSRGERGERSQMSGERPQRTESERPQLPDGDMPQRRQRAEKPEASADTSLSAKSTDTAKTAKYLLPVGMSMGSKDYSSVTAGNTLKIYFGTHPQDGSEIITAVEVVSGRR